MNASLKTRKNVVTFFTYLVLILGSISMIFPFVWMVLTSFKTQAESMAIPPQILPSHWNLDSFVKALQSLPFTNLYLNTGLLILFRVIFAVVFSSMAGYALCQAGISLQKTAVRSGADPDDAAEPDLHYSAVPDAGKDGGHQLHFRCWYSPVWSAPSAPSFCGRRIWASPTRSQRQRIWTAATSGRPSSRSCCR